MDCAVFAEGKTDLSNQPISLSAMPTQNSGRCLTMAGLSIPDFYPRRPHGEGLANGFFNPMAGYRYFQADDGL
jgi:hypothetical protein